MIGNDGQAAESGIRNSYEAAVLDFLNREMDAVQPTHGGKSQSDELDALVSDLLKQVITESDEPQPAGKATPTSIEIAQPKYSPAKNEFSAPRNLETKAALQKDLHPFEGREETFADFMPHLDEVSASKTCTAGPESRSQFNPFEDREDPIAEYMRLQETRASENENSEPDSALDARNFEDMDDVLAEYMPREQSAPAAEVPFALTDAIPESGRLAVEAIDRSADEQSQEEAPAVESTCTASDPGQALSLTQNEYIVPAEQPGSETATLSQEKEAPEMDVGADAAVISRPAPEIPKIRPALTQPIFAAPVARRSKTLLIAAACFCVLVGIAVPAYFHSDNETKQAESQAAAGAQLGPNGETPAVPILQISPRYPETALRNRESASVTLELSIDREGNVVNATAVSGPALFHGEAIRAAMKWRYKPASLAGTNIASKSRVSLNFNLKK